MARPSTGKRLRFRVFERDSFTCQYCGKKPPEVILHADHIFPVSKGGKDEIENLITACADCNLGKNSMELGTAPRQTRKNAEDLQERYDQLRAFYALQKRMDSLKTEILDDVVNYWEEAWGNSELTATGRTSIKRLLTIVSADDVREAIDIAVNKGIGPTNGFKYMCGVVHTMRKQRDAQRI